MYVSLIKDMKSHLIQVILVQSDKGHKRFDDLYPLDSDGITRLFSDIDKYFNDDNHSTISKKNLVGNMIDFDVLLKEFAITVNNEDKSSYDIIRQSASVEIAHKVRQIDRYQTDKHVVFDVQCAEHMVLIIVDKQTGEVSDIRTIGQGDTEAKTRFKKFIEKDGKPFIEYMKTCQTVL